MSWVRMDDRFPEHPKAIKVGALGRDLYVSGLCYSGRNLTDGFIPADAVRRLSELRNVNEIASRLVEVVLWEVVDGGFQVHDYLDYNPSAQEVRSKRKADTKRKGKSARSPRGIPVEPAGNPGGIQEDSVGNPSLAPAYLPYPNPNPYPLDASPPETVAPAPPPEAKGLDELAFYTPGGPTEWQDMMGRELAKTSRSNPVALLVKMVEHVSAKPPEPDVFVRAGVLVKTHLGGNYSYAMRLIWNNAGRAEDDLIKYVTAAVVSGKAKGEGHSPRRQNPSEAEETDYERIDAERAADREVREQSGA